MARQEGLARLYYALLTKDQYGSAPTWGAPVEIPQIIEISTQDTKTSWKWYSNNSIEESGEQVDAVTVNVELGYATPQLLATLCGNSYDVESGAKKRKSNDIQPELALLWETTKSNGESDYRVLYRGVLAVDSKTNRTKEESKTPANVFLTGTFVPLKSTKDIDLEIATDDENASSEMLTNFFTEVQI